jgi:Sel1 repeat
MRAIVVLSVLSVACATATVRVNNVREIPLKEEGESWRYAFFDAATRALAKRGFTLQVSDRPAVSNTSWKGITGLVADEPNLILSFKMQLTTTNQSVRLNAHIGTCYGPGAWGRGPNILCTDEMAGGAESPSFPTNVAQAFETYIADIENEIRREVGPIYQDLLKRGQLAGPAAPAVAQSAPAQDCHDAPDCALQCDGKVGAACARLAAMLENGFGVPVDKKRAADYYKRACDAGHQASCGKR